MCIYVYICGGGPTQNLYCVGFIASQVDPETLLVLTPKPSCANAVDPETFPVLQNPLEQPPATPHTPPLVFVCGVFEWFHSFSYISIPFGPCV